MSCVISCQYLEVRQTQSTQSKIEENEILANKAKRLRYRIQEAQIAQDPQTASLAKQELEMVLAKMELNRTGSTYPSYKEEYLDDSSNYLSETPLTKKYESRSSNLLNTLNTRSVNYNSTRSSSGVQ